MNVYVHYEIMCFIIFCVYECVVHYENTLMQDTEIFKVVKNDNFQWKNFDIFLIFAKNIDCGYTLEPPLCEAVLTSTHNLCFTEKYTCIPQFFYIKVGFGGGIYCSDMFS